MKATEYDIKIKKVIPKYQEMLNVIVSLIPFQKSASIRVLDLEIGTGKFIFEGP